MITEKTLYYDPALLKPWHGGTLPEQWFQEYPHIFDKDDLRITRRQLSRHFGEWFVAIHYAKQGYRVLVEKYIYKNHPCKERILSQCLKRGQIQFLKDGPTQPRDLFVYRGRRISSLRLREIETLSRRLKNVGLRK